MKNIARADKVSKELLHESIANKETQAQLNRALGKVERLESAVGEATRKMEESDKTCACLQGQLAGLSDTINQFGGVVRMEADREKTTK